MKTSSKIARLMWYSIETGESWNDQMLTNVMRIKSILCLFATVPFLVACGGSKPIKSKVPVDEHVQKVTFTEHLKPLRDLISKGEGDYDAVNRGRAGDTPQGIVDLTGKKFENHSVGEVLSLQKTSVFAVGRYQFIPKTLRFAVSESNVNTKDKFTNKVQDQLFTVLVSHKRPVIGGYLLGEHDNVEGALDDLAREWASVEFRKGTSYYQGRGGNKAHISRADAKVVLEKIRNDIEDRDEETEVQHSEVSFREEELQDSGLDQGLPSVEGGD